MKKHLYLRAHTFYDSAVLTWQSNVDSIKTNRDTRLVVSYLLCMSIELVLKQLLDDLTGSHDKIHNVDALCEAVYDLTISNEKLSLISASRLREIINSIELNARLYSKISYGSRYDENIEINENKLKELEDSAEKLLLFYSSVEDSLNER